MPRRTNGTNPKSMDSGLIGRSLCRVLPVLLAGTAGAEEKVTFEDHIFPIFEQSCLNCHNPDKQKGGLDLSNYSGAMRGGSGGKVAEVGDGASSVLYTSVMHTSENKMPPKGDKIPQEQADLIRSWIDGGLLETKDSTAKKRSGPKIAAVQIDPNSKPDGPPPMPEHLSLEPAVVGLRATAVADMAASPWAPLLAITGQKQVLLYNTETLQLAAILPFDEGQPESLSFHPSGKYLLAGGGIPGKSGTTITWDVTTGEEVMRLGKAFDSVLGASLRQDLGAVATGGPSRLIKMWDPQSGEQDKSIKKHTDWITSLAYSPDGILLATADRNGGVWVWEAASGNEFHTLRAHQKGITAVRWRADSNLLATASEDGQVVFWEMNNGNEVKKINAHGGGVLAMDYARDGRFITSGRDNRVRIWKADFNQEKELPPFEDLVVEVASTSDGTRFFTATWNGKITAWDGTTFEPLGELDANPPHIADRVARLEQGISSLPDEVSAAQGKVQEAERLLAEARKNQEEAIQRRDMAKQGIEQLNQEEIALREEWTQLDGRRNELAAMREQHKGSLDQARQKLEQHRHALQKAEEDLAALGEPPLDEEGKKLAAESEKWKAEAEQHPEDAGRKRRAEEAAKRLQDHLQLMASNDKERQSAMDRVAQSKAQAEEFQRELAAAEAMWQESEPEWVRLEQRREQISGRQKQIGPERDALTAALPGMETAIQPAQEQVAAREQEVAPFKAELEKVQAREGELRRQLAFWQAAAVNHEALGARARHEELKLQQDAALADFDEGTTELAALGEQLSNPADEEARRKTESTINELTAKLAELKAAIDQRAPDLAKAEQEAQALRARYEELSQ